MAQNDIHTSEDVDRLRERTESLNTKISALKDNLEGCKNRYDVYLDIFKTYTEISQGDYISNLVDEKKQRSEQESKKRKKSL
ncbi:MAG: hypothetical protein IJ149_04770 [Oscillospiraceae bacterium]|nr:hypothetical protein [Oscillospiraceae bacterium]